MAVTTDHLQVPEAPEPVAVLPTKSSRRGVVGWVATVAGVTAATALTVAVLTSGSTPTRIESVRSIADRGSITAIDHRDAVVAARVAQAHGADRHLEIRAAEIAQARVRGSDRHLENLAAESAQARVRGSDRHLDNLAGASSERP